MKKFLFLILIVFVSLSCTRIEKRKVWQQTFIAFDTTVTISIPDNNLTSAKFNKIIEQLEELSIKFDLIFNMYNKKSELYKIQFFKADRFYPISDELYFLIKECKEYYKKTEGSFDVTIGKITQLYNFHKNRIPNADQIKKRLVYVGMDKMILEQSRIKLLKPGMRIDLGGVAKGYIIDQFSEFLIEKGYHDFLVNIGGDIFAKGKNGESQKWRIGIQHPKKKGALIGNISIKDQAIVTSGDYERYVKRKTKRYHHILNPQTGLPVWNNIVSVTVVADKAVVSDFLSTAIFVMGIDKARDMIKKYYPSAKYYIVQEINDQLKIIDHL